MIQIFTYFNEVYIIMYCIYIVYTTVAGTLPF